MRDAWSELSFGVDKYFFARIASNKLRGPQKLKIRCETNMYNLYKGAAELDMEIVDDPLVGNGIGDIHISPTIDLWGNKNDPDNSALTGCGARVRTNSVLIHVVSSSFIFCLLIPLLCGTSLDIWSSLSSLSTSMGNGRL